MKAAPRYGLGLLAATALGVLVWVLVRVPEPVYQGKALSFWLELHHQKAWVPGSVMQGEITDCEETALAIRAIGTNAIPSLLRLTATSDSTSKQWIVKHCGSAGSKGRLGLRSMLIHWAGQPVVGPEKAQLGFRVLGPAAQAAVPELVRIMRRSRNPNGRLAAVYSLGRIGPGAERAIPALLENFKDSDSSLRVETTRTILSVAVNPLTGRVRPECSRLIIPPLTRLLADPTADSLRILYILRIIGPDAKDAIPAVLSFMGSSDRVIREMAVTARDRIMGGEKVGEQK